MAYVGILLGFLVSLIVSSVIIYFATKLFGEKEGFGTALLAAAIGAILFALVSFFLGAGWIAALIGGVAWLIALGSLYQIGWLKSFLIAIIIWVFSVIVGMLLLIIGAFLQYIQKLQTR